MSEVTVRAARVGDESALLELAREEMRAHEAMDARFRLREDANERYALYLRSRMRDLDSSVFVAVRGDEVVGLAIGSIRKEDGFFVTRRYGYVSDLMVAPSLRLRGVGRALYERVVLWFRSLGIGVVRLHVATRSDGARAFWKRIGAEDLMAEAWIDLKKIEPNEEASEGPPSGEDLTLPPTSPNEPHSFGTGRW